MATFQIEPGLPATITPELGLSGWRREFCIELLGDGRARVFLRNVEGTSLKATELQRATLFHRLDPRLADVAGCVEAVRADLERLVDGARRTQPSRDNLYSTVEYDRALWDRVQQGIDRWARRAIARG